MIRPSFGKRKSTPAPAATPVIDALLVPKGAVISSDVWAMGEALHIFITDAQERSLFGLEDLPGDAVAVFRAYELANELENFTLSGWHGNTNPSAERIDQTILGLRLIGSHEIADVATQARAAWAGGEPLDDFTTKREMEARLVGQCSAWVRHSPLTRVLGDGNLDTVYKETMKRLGRCNPEYPRRRLADDERRRRLNLKPRPPLDGSPCTLDALIAEMQACFGS